MKNYVFFLGSLLIAATAVFFLHNWLAEQNDPGYVLIGIGHWSLETSLTVFSAGEVILFFYPILGLSLARYVDTHARPIKQT